MYIYWVYALIILIHIFLIILLLKKVKEDKNLWFLVIFNFGIICWTIFAWLLMEMHTSDSVIWFVRLTYVSATVIAASFVIFIRYNIYKKYDFLTILITSLSIPILFFSLSHYLIEDVDIIGSSPFVPVVFGKFAYIFVIYFILVVASLLVSFWKRKNYVEGLELLRLKYVTLGMIIGGVIALSTNVIIPFFTGSSETAPLGPVAISIIAILTTYSYVKKRLFGIKFLVGKVLYYFSLVLVPFLFFVLLLSLLALLKLTYVDFMSYIIAVIASISFVLLYSFLWRILDENLNPIIGFKSSSTENIREIFLRNISTELNIEKLGVITLKSIDDIFDLKKSGIVIFNAEDSSIIYKKLREFGEQPLDNHNLLQVIQYWDKVNHSTVITKDELENSELTDIHLKRILTFMQKDEIEIILPLNRKVHLNGVIILGGKNNRNPFTVEDIHYLEALIINSSVAFSRSILYSQVQDLNISLQQKVNDQTKELQIKVEQLQEARKKERDMIDIMGHELRTPATIVKLNTDLLEQFTGDILNNQEKFELYIKRIRTAVDNEIKLINTLLSSAKLEGEKIELNLEEVNILEDIEMAIHGHSIATEEKGLHLVNNADPNTPSMYVDHARVMEVLNNLVDNAIKYTEEGSITISTSYSEDTVSVSVQDTGKGIPKEELPKLGKKFYRIENYLNDKEGKPDLVRPGGTGLGLYVTFSLVRKMGGEMVVRSEVGKGSNFTFTLPRYKGQVSKDNLNRSNNMFERLGLSK